MDIGYYLLMIILMILGLVAAYLIPSKKDLMNQEKGDGLSPKFTFVYIIALFICIIFIYFLITTLIDMESMLTLPVLVNLILSGIIGIGLLFENYNRSALKSKIEVEGSPATSVAEVEPHEVTAEDVKSEPVKAGGKDEQKVIKCPKCSKYIRIKTTERPIQIACPHCGVKGELR
jgi:hypothetical protein